MTASLLLRLAPVLAYGVLALLAPPALAQPGPGAGGPPAVGVVKAERRAVTESTEFIGRIQAVNRVELIARVTGFIEKIEFNEGSEVRAGEVLYRLRPSGDAGAGARAGEPDGRSPSATGLDG